MKIGKTAWIFLASGIFVILVAGLGMAYSQHSQEQSRLTEELALAQLRLERYPLQQLSSQKEELESRLAQVEPQLIAAKASLYQSTESIEASTALFELAEDCNVEVTGLGSPGVTTKKLEKVNFSALPLIVTIEGDVLNLIDFVYKWVKDYPTGVVQAVEITVPEPPGEETAPEEEEVIATEEEKPSAIINLLIYHYEGD